MANTDRRGTLRRHPVYRKELGTITMLAAGTTRVAASIDLNGIIGTIVLVLPDSGNGVTCTIDVKDEDSYTLYSAGGKADSTTHVLTGVDILVAGVITIGLTASSAPGGTSWIGTVVLYSV